MSPCSHIDQSLLLSHYLQEEIASIFQKTKCTAKKFHRPKESFEKTSWHSNNFIFMKQFPLVNKLHCVYTQNEDH